MNRQDDLTICQTIIYLYSLADRTSKLRHQMGTNRSNIFKCNVCRQSASHRLIMTKADRIRRVGTAYLFKCARCGVTILGSESDSFDSDLYSYYDRLSDASEAETYPALTYDRYVALLDGFASRLKGREFLDVGCGVGGFVAAAIDNGWRGMGIDLAEGAVKVGRRFNLPLQCTNFFSASIADQSKDLITMFEFIEHVPDPGAFLKRAEDVLRPGGILYLTTPNFNSLDRLLLGHRWEAIHVEHLTYFTPRTLKRLLADRTGLHLVEMQTRNMSVGLTSAVLSRFVRSDSVRSKAHDGIAPSCDARASIENSATLRAVKHLVNKALAFTRLGCTMNVTLRKPI